MVFDNILAIMVLSEIERKIKMTFKNLQAAIPTLIQYQIEQISAVESDETYFLDSQKGGL